MQLLMKAETPIDTVLNKCTFLRTNTCSIDYGNKNLFISKIKPYKCPSIYHLQNAYILENTVKQCPYFEQPLQMIYIITVLYSTL